MSSSIDFLLTEKQQEILDAFFKDSSIRWVLSVGGKGSAKTTASVYALINLFFNPQYAKSKVLVARESLRDLKNTLVREFKNHLAKIGLPEDTVYTHHEGLQVFRNLQTDTEIYYLSLSSRNEQYRSVLSYEFNAVIIDELDRITEEAFTEVSQRLRLKHKFNKGLLNLNPVPTTHWIYKKFVEQQFPQTKIVHSSTYTNYLLKRVPIDVFKQKAQPYIFNDKTYFVINNVRYEIVRQEHDHFVVKEFNVSHPFLVEMEHRSYTFRRVMLEGQWGSYDVSDGIYSVYFTEGNIFTGVITPLDLRMYYRIYGGFDFGVRRPAFVLIAEDEWGRYYVIDEILGNDISSIQFVELIRKRLREKWKLDVFDVDIYGDVAGSYREQSDGLSIIAKIREKYGLTIKAQKVKVMDSVFQVRQLLETQIANKPALQISQECELMLAGMLGEFKMDETGRPIKDNYYEHIHDAFRYGIMGALRNKSGGKLQIVTPKY